MTTPKTNTKIEIKIENFFNKITPPISSLSYKYEIRDHLEMLKNKYLSDGFSESKSIELAIKDFGNIKDFISDIKNSLPSKNKVEKFSMYTSLRALLVMGLMYTIFMVLNIGIFHIHSHILVHSSILYFVVVTASLSYIIKELRIKKNVIKSIFIVNFIFFIIEKIIMALFLYTETFVRTNKIGNLKLFLNSIGTFYIFRLEYIFLYWFLTAIGVLFYVSFIDLFENKRNTYNNSLLNNILITFFTILLIVYYLIPNRWYFLRKIIILIMKEDITEVHRNLFYMLINNHFLIPNIGLWGLLTLGIIFAIKNGSHHYKS